MTSWQYAIQIHFQFSSVQFSSERNNVCIHRTKKLVLP